MKIAKLILLICLFIIICTSILNAQIIISDVMEPEKETSTIFDIQSTDKGILLPRLSNEDKNNLEIEDNDKALSLLIYNTDEKCFEARIGGSWRQVWCCAPEPPTEKEHVVEENQITWNWNKNHRAERYYYSFEDESFDISLEHTENTYINQTGLNLDCGDIKYLFIWSFNECDEPKRRAVFKVEYECED